MRVKTIFVIASLVFLSTLTNPIFIKSQQKDICLMPDDERMKLKVTAQQICLCEQTAANISPRYEISDAVFGIKSARKKSSSTRLGVASARGGAVERTQRTKMLGKLEIPNADESKSPEVENLRKKVQRAREKRRAMVEQWWQRFNQPPTRKKWLPCDPPQTDCKPTKYIQEPVPLVLGNRKFKTKEELEQHRAEVQSVYARYQDLQNTSDWHRLPKFDWRTRGLDVGKVMQQGECGSCWAFASVSTYQCAWNLEQMRLGEDFLELVIDYNQFRRQPSVQQLLNCMSKKKGDCDWGWHGSAFAFMVNNHVPHIPDRLVWNKEYTAAIEEYTGKKSACINPFRKLDVKRSGIVGVPVDGRESNFRLRRDSDRFVTAFDRALTWGYVNEPFDEMPSVEKLKTALIEHGPLAVSIYSDYCFSVYKSGVFNGKNKQSVNHVVVLIGWDDEKKAWLIKNSWGEDWGEKGFGWVEYESNNVGLFAAWIQPTPITLGL